jgi:hypothetical protein
MPHSPHTLLEEILIDAYLDSLGREDWPTRSKVLRPPRRFGQRGQPARQHIEPAATSR